MVYNISKRFFDIFFALVLSLILVVPFLFLTIIIRLSSEGPALYWSERVGVQNKLFKMPKFRSMRVGTPVVASNLLGNPKDYLTRLGSMLRKSSFDELPQLWSILIGDMTFVGPRPALSNQIDLIEMRIQNNIHTLTPGLTGWAQVNGRDELSTNKKVEFDLFYLKNKNFIFDLKICYLTILKVIKRQNILH